MKEQIILIKLGGSLITNKSKPFSERRDIIVELAEQISRAWKQNNINLIIGHGGGSYPHVPAEKYRTIEGMVNDESMYGAAVVEDAAAQLNRIVVNELLKKQLPAISVNPSSCLLLHENANGHTLSPLKKMLTLGFIPVVYGDILFDKNDSFTIWSTEKILNFLAEDLQKNGYLIGKIIHCGETDGFMVDGEVIKEITTANFAKFKENITQTKGFDVTGGMLHKVEEALVAANKGITSYIIGGNHGGNLYRAIIGEKFIGTKITV